MRDNLPPYDSFLLVSFGGPEGPDDVMPYLENVLRGKRVPRERMLEVAQHYQSFGGVSPINEQNRELMAAILSEFRQHDVDLPVYWGNRNWKPYFAETLQQMKDDGCRRAIAFFTSMFSCYSGCRQYRENIAEAQAQVGPDAPIVEKVRMGFNHPHFIDTLADSVRQAAKSLASDHVADTLMFTAHSIPNSMADNCDYVLQLNETCRLVAEAAGFETWELVFQSRSGPPQQPWLEPDVCDRIEQKHRESPIGGLVLMPVGFVSDHMEVLYDLDDEAATLCKKLGIPLARAATPGTAPKFVQMIRELVQERIANSDQRAAVGKLGPWHDVCPQDCCLYTPARRPASAGR
ncbi:ferrochelatase [Crateriforma spongiae]|uniref:ferrochelatase n=1 Tax=Crateriforma spongiae TaxID=2724528 RepID=UPI0014465128|nr:ferrochelatase [Crateriforma spongiae]